MTVLPRLVAIAALFAAQFSHAEDKLTGNTTPDAKKSAETAIPDYETAAQIKAMPPCKAVLEHDGTCVFSFTTTDGKKFWIGSPASKQDVIRFLQSLKVGETYELPKAFLDYQNRKPR